MNYGFRTRLKEWCDVLKNASRGTLSIFAAAGLLAASICWMACGDSGDSGGSKPATPLPNPGPELPTSTEGWTEFTASADTLTIYVSSSTGNDANDGLSPATPKATLNAGKALLRTGMPDWLLLKAGDTWTNQNFGNFTKSGRGPLEPMLISSYDTGARPLVRTGTDNALVMQTTSVSNVAIVGLHFEAHTYTGTEGSTGIRLLTTCDNILFEDLFVEGYKDNFVLQADAGFGTISNIRLRRCVVVDAYSATAGHAQGFYGSRVDGLLIEECTFDHNGWREDGGGDATVFNHNTYISSCANVVLRGNLILRSSSIGTKFATESATAFSGLLVENNFYIEGEIGMSCGGNENGAFRFVNVTVRDNVMMHIGRSQPTGRTLSFYVDLQDWDGGLIEDNLFLHQPLAFDTYGIHLAGETERQITIQNNIFYGLSDKSIVADVTNTETGISVIGNHFQDPTEGSQMVEHDGSFGAVTYQNNSYFTSASASAWFRVNGTSRSHAEWVTLSGETGSTTTAQSYPDPLRNEVTYQAFLGGTPSILAYVAEARKQSKALWRPAYTADAINDYIREGFGR